MTATQILATIEARRKFRRFMWRHFGIRWLFWSRQRRNKAFKTWRFGFAYDASTTRLKKFIESLPR